MDYRTLDTMRRTHPAWRLLAADNAPLIIGFLYQSFIQPNQRALPQQELVSRLEDYLYHLREQSGDGVYPNPPIRYLDDWASNAHAWLRKYYPANSDEPHYDVTPATEKVIDWLISLRRRQFVGTESRLMTVFELLRQMTEGSEQDSATRVAELEKRKAQIDADIQRIREGELVLMDATGIKDRFLQMAGTGAGAAFGLSRSGAKLPRTRPRRAGAHCNLGGRQGGALLEEIFGQRDAIADSDQGKTFRAFWNFLMSPERQEELSSLLQAVFALHAVQDLAPDRRLLRIHYDWLEAGEVAQRTVARLSEQLRRYLDDQAWMENRRIMQLIRGVEQHALAVRSQTPGDPFMELDESAPEIDLTMDRPLFSPPFKPRLTDQIVLEGNEDVPSDALFGQVYVDKPRLASQIRRALQNRHQVSLAEVVESYPLEQGLAELVAYLSLGAEDRKAVIDDTQTQTLIWIDVSGKIRQATLPLVIFNREAQPIAGSWRPQS